MLYGLQSLAPRKAAASSLSSSALWLMLGTYEFVVPAGVYSVSMLCIGKGGDGKSTGSSSGGGGGGLAYVNEVPVSPGEKLTVEVSSVASRIGRAGSWLVQAFAGSDGIAGAGGAPGGSFSIAAGLSGSGNNGGASKGVHGGGAAGFTGAGVAAFSDPGAAGPGGAATMIRPGMGAIGYASGYAGPAGSFGGGGGGATSGIPTPGGLPAVWIVWPGKDRQFPDVNVSTS